MRLVSILTAASALAMIGCSSSQKQSTTTATPAQAAPTTATPATAAATAKAAETAKVEAAKSTALSSMTCSRTGDERSLEIQNVTPKGCELWYQRSGTRSKSAWSENGNTHCESVRDRIRTNLENAGFKCADSTTAQAKVEAPAPAPASTAKAAAPASQAKAEAQPQPAAKK